MTSRSKMNLIAGFLLGVCLFISQMTHAEKQKTPCWRVWNRTSSSVFNAMRLYMVQPVQQLKESLFSPRVYFLGFPFDHNDISSIRQALSLDKGDGAAIVDINPFTPEIAEKVRQAINASYSSELHFLRHLVVFEEEGDWEIFQNRLLSDNRIISSEEVNQFRQEVDEYLAQVKQTILKMDGRNIELTFLAIRTEQMRRGFVKHAHDKPAHAHWYVSASVAPVGLGTYYVQSLNGERKKILSHSGHTLLMTDQRRIRILSERGDPPSHGTPLYSWFNPHYQGERLFLLGVFKLSEQKP